MNGAAPKVDQKRLGFWRLVAFSGPGLALAGVQIPLQGYLPAFYAQHGGLSLSLVGLLFMLSRLWNAFTDPFVGVMSDRTATRFGRRRPWIGVGGTLLLLCSALVFFPPENAGALYLSVGLFGLYLGSSMLSTPLYAWSADLSTYYHERTRIQAFLQTIASVGLLLILLVPALQDWRGVGTLASKVTAMGSFVIIALVVSVPLLLLAFRERVVALPVRTQKFKVGTVLAQLLDPLVLRVMASDFFVSLGQGCRGALLLYFVTAYMGLSRWLVLLQIAQFVFGIAASPLWLRLSYRLGKRRTVIAGELVQIAINLSLLALVPGQLWAMVALTVAQGLAQGSGNLMLRSIVADVADVQRLKTGEERSGLLFSIFSVTSNAGMALAVGITFAILARCGFVPGGQNGPIVLDRLHYLFAVAPAIGHALSALLIWRFPLDETGHAQILRELELRAPSAPAAASTDLPAAVSAA